MAVMPGVTYKWLPENETQPAIVPIQVIVHTAVDAPGRSNIPGYFARADVGVESTFYVYRGGETVQMMDSEVRADANRYANNRAISVEMEDEGDPEGVPFDDKQIAALKAIIQWAHSTHGIPIVQCPGPYSPGIGWHSMWGFEDPINLTGRKDNPWSTSWGKTCPGKTRIAQTVQIIKDLSGGNEMAALSKAEAEVWIDIFYRSILGRAGDAGGRADWINKAVSNKWSRDDLFFNFLGGAQREAGALAESVASLSNRVAALEKKTTEQGVKISSLEARMTAEEKKVTAPVAGQTDIDYSLVAAYVLNEITDRLS